MSDQSVDPSVEATAFREAGHAVMAYLILRGGIADPFFAMPIPDGDRMLLIPEFEVVAADGELSELAKPTTSLRGLITVPLFVFAGFAAQRIHMDPSTLPAAGNSRAEGLARGMIAGYWEELGGGKAMPPSKAMPFMNHWNEVAYQAMRDHWPAVRGLAERLLEDGELGREEAFDAIERHLAERKGQAE